MRGETKVHKLHQKYILKKGTGTLGDTGVHRRKTEPIFIHRPDSLLISKLVQHINTIFLM